MSKRSLKFLFVPAFAAWAVVACSGDDDATDAAGTDGGPSPDVTTAPDTAPPPVTDSGVDSGTDAGVDSGTDAGTDAGVDSGSDAGVDSGTDAGVDSGTDAGVDSGTDAGVDSGSDAGTSAIVNGTYTLTTWTCGAKDLLAMLKAATAATGVEYQFNGATGSTDVIYSATCRRVNATNISYPMSGEVSFLEGASTCSATCVAANNCVTAAKPAPDLVDTYDYTTAGTTVTATRTLTATYLMRTTFQSFAGCQANDTETAVITKN